MEGRHRRAGRTAQYDLQDLRHHRPHPPRLDRADLAPAVNHCLNSFGPDRVVFGGDWPVCTLGADATYRSWAEALREIIAGRSETEQRKLLHDNAAAFYALV